MTTKRLGWIIGLLLAVVAVSSTAEAQQRRGRAIQGVRIEAHLDLAFHDSLGLGVRFDIPVVPDGLIDGVHDELAVSPGAELFFFDYHDDYHCHRGSCHDHDDGVALWPLVAMQWNFYLNEDWSVFPELGLVLQLFNDFDHDHNDSHVDIDPLLAVGGRYHFNDRNALVLRIGWPSGLAIGITF